MLRNQASLSIAVFTDDAEASLAGLFSHSSRVIPSPASTSSIRSRSARTSPVSRCPTICAVRSPAPLRAVPTIFASTIAPGRITFADTRYSRARLPDLDDEILACLLEYAAIEGAGHREQSVIDHAGNGTKGLVDGRITDMCRPPPPYGLIL